MSSRPPWLGYALLVVGVACLAVSGDFVGMTGGSVLRLLAGLLAVAMLVWGAWHHGAGARTAWLLLALGIGGWVVGDALWDTFDAAHFPVSSGWYDVVNVLYLCMYPVVFVALIRIVDAHREQRNVDNVVDSAIMFLSAVLLLQIFVINPGLTGHAALDGFKSLYPFGDALLLAAIGWLVFTHGRRNPSAWLLGTGIVLLTFVDAAWETSARPAFASLDQWINPLYPISYALIAAAVLYPSAADLAEAGETQPPELHPARLAFLCAALGLIPVAAFLGSSAGLLVEVGVTALVAAIAIRLIALVRSIQEAHRQAVASATRFANLAAAAPVAIVESDAELTIVFANGEADRFLGVSMIGMSAERLIAEVVDDRDQPSLNQAIATVIDGGVASAQVRIRDSKGSQRWVTWSAVPVQPGTGPFAGAFVSITDITPIKDAEEMLTLQVTHDPLTGLPNRRMLLDRLTTAITRLGRVPSTLAVLFVDLDGFKPVNDRLGHDAGDALLELAATRILHAVRAEDTVARWGGDEFVVILERVTDAAHALTVADKIIQAISAPAPLAHTEVSISACVGIAISSNPHVQPDALLRDADTAMYAAKRAGKGLARVSEQTTRPRPGPEPRQSLPTS